MNRIFINRYRSTWYNMPIEIQKILLTMQMRSSKSCKLTAGIYEMNIENFGIVRTYY